MKAATLLLYFFLCSAIVSAQYTAASISGYTNGSNVTYIDPLTGSLETRFAGLLNGRLIDTSTGPAVSYYFLDAKIPLGYNLPRNDYFDDIISDGIDRHACWIINNFYPGDTATGQLSDLNLEASAIQFAIWHFTSGIQLNTITNPTIRNRALEIQNMAANNACGVRLSVEFVLDEDPEYFSIRTVDDNGNPIAVDSIVLYYDEGILSSYLVNTTLPLGISERVQVIGANTGLIGAFSRKFVFPKSSIFRHQSPDFPRIFLAEPGFGPRHFTYDWGTLPVELTSFNSFVHGSDVELKWSTSMEINNSHFEIERKSVPGIWKSVGLVSGSGTVNFPTDYDFKDRNVAIGNYRYRLKQVDYNGNYEYFDLQQLVTVGIPVRFELGQNYPNPFNPSTKIYYKLHTSDFTTLKVFDMTGKQIAVLVNKRQEAGTYEVNFSASQFGLTAGVYVYKLDSGGFSITKKMVVLE